MLVLILGLFLFFGIHSTRFVASGWRTRTLAHLGEGGYKGVHSVVSAVGLVLIVWGFSLAQQQPVVLWTPPVWTRHAAALLVLVAFVLVTAAYVPGNRIKARIGHPMVAGVKIWALAHLLANGTLADVLLFGAFLLWAVACFASARRRDRAAGTTYPPGSTSGDVLTVGLGMGTYLAFGLWLHVWLFGVRPFG
jgi:uncharacterized membrane protein